MYANRPNTDMEKAAVLFCGSSILADKKAAAGSLRDLCRSLSILKNQILFSSGSQALPALPRTS